MEGNELKRKNRSPTNNNAFAAPRPKKQRTKSPSLSHNANVDNNNNNNTNNNNRNFSSEIHENKYNVSYSYYYDKNGVIPANNLIKLKNKNTKSKRIEIRIPLSLLSITNNFNIMKRNLWGGGHMNNNLYTSDSDIICILYHLGIINKYQSTLDPFCIFNNSLTENMNHNNNKQPIKNNNYDFMYIRTSHHKLTDNEIKKEQHKSLTNDKLYQIFGNKDIIGIAAIFDVISKKKDMYYSVNKNGYYSRKWVNKNNEIKTSLKLKYIYPLTNFNEFVIDNKYLFPMIIHNNNNNNNNEINRNDTEKYDTFIHETDIVGFELNYDNKPCLKYNISIISNAHLLINENDWKEENKNEKQMEQKTKNELNETDSENSDNSDHENEKEKNKKQTYLYHKNNALNDEKRYGHLLQFRLYKFILIMENNKCQYQLIYNTKSNKYKFIKMEFTNHLYYNKINNSHQNQRKQRHHTSKGLNIYDDLNWNDLKWSNKGVNIRDKLYAINKVWFVKK